MAFSTHFTGSPGTIGRSSHHSRRRRMREEEDDDDGQSDPMRYDGQSATSVLLEKQSANSIIIDQMDHGSNDSDDIDVNDVNDGLMNMSAPIPTTSLLLTPLRKQKNNTDTMRINTADLNEIEMDIDQLVQEVQDVDNEENDGMYGQSGQSESGITATPIPALPSIQSSRELKSVIAEQVMEQQRRQQLFGMRGQDVYVSDQASMGPVNGDTTVSTNSEHLELADNVHSNESVRL